MSAAAEAVDEALAHVVKLRTALLRANRPQIRTESEKLALKVLASDWFDRQSPAVRRLSSVRLDVADGLFTQMHDASARASSRKACVVGLRELRDELLSVRAQVVAAESVSAASSKATTSIPSFAKLVSNVEMQQILTRRWQEAERCLTAGASLAAIVMMGGLLEALFMARIEHLADKSPVFKAKAVPKDKNGSSLPQKEWTLNNYIEIAHELKWIGATAKSVGSVLRDYRNYIHPYKELTDGVALTGDDANMLWTVFVTLTDQLLRL